MKHTPGPWSSTSNLVSSTLFFFMDADGNLLGETLGLNRIAEENLANARLIAASPELLKVCVDTASMLREYCADMELTDHQKDICNTLILNLELAIAKAKI